MQKHSRSSYRWCALIAGVAAAWLVPIPEVRAQDAGGKKYAVLVGVNEYQHKNLPALGYAVNDVTELSQVLQKAGYDVALLCDATGKRDEGLAPTKANVEARLKKMLQKCRKGDSVLLGFAGHGLQFKDQKDSYFCPSDARPYADRTESLVSLGKIYEELDASFAGVKIMLVDACRNDPRGGRGSRGVDADSAPPPPRGVAALFSCSTGETAYEDDRLKHGVFFHFVLQGLRGEARDRDGEVTFDGLSSYVRKQVSREVPKMYGAGTQQSPNLKADLSGESPVLVQVIAGGIPKMPSDERTVDGQSLQEKMKLGEGPGKTVETKKKAAESTVPDDGGASNGNEQEPNFRFAQGGNKLEKISGNNPVWQAALGGAIESVKSNPAGDTVFAATAGGVYCLSSATGKLVWSNSSVKEGKISFDTDGYLAVTSKEGKVSRFVSKTGQPVK